MFAGPEIAPFGARLLSDPLGQLRTPEAPVFFSGANGLVLFVPAIIFLLLVVRHALRNPNPFLAALAAMVLAGVFVPHRFEFGRIAIPLIEP